MDQEQEDQTEAQPAWADQMNAEYEAATTDEERLVVLEKYVGPRTAGTDARTGRPVWVNSTGALPDNLVDGMPDPA